MEDKKAMKKFGKIFMGVGFFYIILVFVIYYFIVKETGETPMLVFILQLLNGVGFFIMGFTINIINDRRMKEIDYLLENGVHLRATVDSVTIGANRFKNIKNRKVICTYEEGGKKYIFKSDNIYRKVENNIHKGDTINVYADPEEYKKYYVDVKE